MNSEEDKKGDPNPIDHSRGRGCGRKNKNQDLRRKNYILEIISRAEEKSSTQGKIIKKKRLVNITPQKP